MGPTRADADFRHSRILERLGSPWAPGWGGAFRDYRRVGRGAGKAVGEVVAVTPELHEVENGRWPIGLATNGSVGDADPRTQLEIAGGVVVVGVAYLRLPDTFPSEKGTLVWPSLQGATNWFSPSYSPRTRLFYVAVREMGAYYFKGEAKYEPGTSFLGGGEQAVRGDQASGAVRALDVMTGRLMWEFKLHSPPLGRPVVHGR